jgi:hypothetical protein
VIEVEALRPPTPKVVTLSDSSIVSTDISSEFMSNDGQYDWSDESPGGTKTLFWILQVARPMKLHIPKTDQPGSAELFQHGCC